MKSNAKKTRYTRGGCLKMAMIPGSIAILILAFTIVTQLQINARQNTVNAMNDAYVAEDCPTVIQLGTEILNDEQQRLNAQQAARENIRLCERYLEAQTALSSGDIGEALGKYLMIYDSSDDRLKIAEKVQTLYTGNDFETLQHENGCLYLEDLRQIMGDDETLPDYHLACAKFLESIQTYRSSITTYNKVIELYPDSPAADEAIAAIPGALYGQSIEPLESETVTARDYEIAVTASEKFIAEYPDNERAENAAANIPILLLQWAERLLEGDASLLDQEIALEPLNRFRTEYPDHADFAQADDLYASTLLNLGLENSAPNTSTNSLELALGGASGDASTQFDDATNYLTQFIDTYPDHPDIETANQALADVLYNGGVYSKAVVENAAVFQDYSRAIIFLTRFVERYPDDSRSETARSTLDDLLKLQEAIAGEIPQPDAVPIDGDETILIIQNASPYTIRISLIGDGINTDIRQESLPPCETCETYTSAPATCPQDGPAGTYTVRPGQYQVSVSSGDINITPFFGFWELLGGFEYPNCFFIVESR